MTAIWATSTVGEQFDVQLGKMLDAAKNVGVPKPYIGNRAVQWGRVDVSAGGIVPMTRSDLQRYRLQAGDLLVCEGGDVGRGAIWRNELSECYYQKALHRLRAKRGYDARLMLALLQYWSSIGAFSDFVTQTSIAHLPREKFVLMPLPLPPKEEQRRIGKALQDADDLIATLERLIAKKQAIKQGMMQQLLTGRTRLPGFNAAWRSRSLGELLSYEQPSRYLVSSTDYTRAGTPVLTAGKTFVLGRTTERHGIFEDVPVIIFDDFTTASKYVDFPFKAKSSAMKMLSARDGGNLRYIFERMQLIDFAAVDHKRRWIAEFSKIEINVPDKDEQDAVVVVLEDFDAEIDLLKHRLAQARAIKTGMMQQLLTGRVRLPAEASA